jgi:RNA polymerase sigma-70 factor (sigma-E family)
MTSDKLLTSRRAKGRPMQDARDEEFSQYVVARRGQLRRTAYLISGDWQLAEDLVQTALTKLYVAWPRVRRNGSIDGFVRRIIVNSHIDERRRPWRRERSSLDGIDPPAETVGAAIEDRLTLMQALARLAPGQRRVIVLRYFTGLSVEETAADLGCSTGNVKSQTSHGLRRLEELLSPEFDKLG